MSFLRIIVWTVFAGFVGSASAQERPPGSLNDASNAERWEASPLVVYGKVVGIHYAGVSKDQIRYRVKLEVSRCWKGQAGAEIILMDVLPEISPWGKFRFEFDGTYIVFAGKNDHDTAYTRNYAISVILPLPRNSLASIFGNRGPAFEATELVDFLDSKMDKIAAPHASQAPQPGTEQKAIQP